MQVCLHAHGTYVSVLCLRRCDCGAPFCWAYRWPAWRVGCTEHQPHHQARAQLPQCEGFNTVHKYACNANAHAGAHSPTVWGEILLHKTHSIIELCGAVGCDVLWWCLFTVHWKPSPIFLLHHRDLVAVVVVCRASLSLCWSLVAAAALHRARALLNPLRTARFISILCGRASVWGPTENGNILRRETIRGPARSFMFAHGRQIAIGKLSHHAPPPCTSTTGEYAGDAFTRIILLFAKCCRRSALPPTPFCVSRVALCRARSLASFLCLYATRHERQPKIYLHTRHSVLGCHQFNTSSSSSSWLKAEHTRESPMRERYWSMYLYNIQYIFCTHLDTHILWLGG